MDYCLEMRFFELFVEMFVDNGFLLLSYDDIFSDVLFVNFKGIYASFDPILYCLWNGNCLFYD